MAKEKPAVLGTPLLTIDDIRLWYERNPLPEAPIDTHFPLKNTSENTWKTMQNNVLRQNIAADPISSKSKIPVSGREGYKSVLGEMTEFGKGREMDADEIEKWEDLKRRMLANPSDSAIALELINYYGADLQFVRDSAVIERRDLCYSMVSNACDISFAASNSPYLTSLASFEYPLKAWQKDAVSTAWSDPSSEILGDIESVIDAGEAYYKEFRYLFINKKWFNYVRKNTQIQKYCATLAANIYNTQTPPTREVVNAMMSEYFDMPVEFVVIDDSTTREGLDGSKSTSNPFKDGAVVFSPTLQLGTFTWKRLAIVDPSRETYESFFLVGNYKEIDPSFSKVYSKAKGFPTIDGYSDNYYLKIDAVPW